MILTAGSFDELSCRRLSLVLLEVDDGKGRAAGLDERAAELVPEAARCTGDDGDLSGRKVE